ncbi:MAG: ABC transporter permease, partial [Solirubrobacteraceae bacterium]|nr:ABC transporter permease [Solirubrobacteraceae bacterium]
MFYVQYAFAELRRRSGRTVLTALGLGVGVALVVCVGALSQGLDDAQEEVLRPLTGVGTDMSVTRPIEIEGGDGGGAQLGQGGGPGAGLSEAEREQLQEENGAARVGLTDLGEPGESFSQDSFVSTAQLSFPEDEVDAMAALDGAKAVAGGLTLSAIHVEGTVPEAGQNQLGAPGAGGGPPENIDFESRTITGVDPAQPDLGGVTRGQVSSGKWFDPDAKPYEAILTASYAQRQDLEVGDTFDMAEKEFTVVGLSDAPIGGQASDMYVELATLQRLSDRKGR